MACDPNTIIGDADCWLMRSPKERQVAIVILLCRIFDGDTSGNCDPGSILEEGKCWLHRSYIELEAASIQLLCLISAT